MPQPTAVVIDVAAATAWRWHRHGDGMAAAKQRHGSGMAVTGNDMSISGAWQRHRCGNRMPTAWQRRVCEYANASFFRKVRLSQMSPHTCPAGSSRVWSQHVRIFAPGHKVNLVIMNLSCSSRGVGNRSATYATRCQCMTVADILYMVHVFRQGPVVSSASCSRNRRKG